MLNHFSRPRANRRIYLAATVALVLHAVLFVVLARDASGQRANDDAPSSGTASDVDRARASLLPVLLRRDDPLVDKLATRPSWIPGLTIAFALDARNTRYLVPPDQLTRMGLDVESAYTLALGHLRGISAGLRLRDAIDRGEFLMVKVLDTYDATRLLLLPEVLRPGEAVAVIVTNDRTLGVYPVPEDGDWSSLGAMAEKWWVATAPSSRLLERPLRVTSSSCELK